jgi:uncharacterized Zn finger protein
MHCSCPDWEVPCKHLAAVCYVLAEAFDDDPFEMLAWRGRSRSALLTALRQAGPRPGAAAANTSADGGAQDPAEGADAASATHAVLADVTGPPLARALDGFWAPGLSQARLRALAGPQVTTASPDLLLRMFDPPPIVVRGRVLRDVLAPAYEQFAADDDG